MCVYLLNIYASHYPDAITNIAPFPQFGGSSKVGKLPVALLATTEEHRASTSC